MTNIEFKTLRSQLGLTQVEMAKVIGVDVKTIQNWESGRNIPKTKHGILRDIASKNNIKTGRQTANADDMCAPGKQVSEISYTEGVPYYDQDFLLGFNALIPSNCENPDYLIRMPGYERATLWCNASGHSMEPEINNGDIIALQRIEDFSFLPYGDIYGFVTTNGLGTIKRLGRSDRDGYYRLIPTNKEYDAQDIPITKILFVYRVMGAMKQF